jgi:hypothetical protein
VSRVIVDRPKDYINYIYVYPEGCIKPDGTDMSNRVFYVGKATGYHRIDNHLIEAGGGCECQKCQEIRWIWSLGKVPGRQIVFETLSEKEAFANEQYLIREVYVDEPLTNFQFTSKIAVQRPLIGDGKAKRCAPAFRVNLPTPPSVRDREVTPYLEREKYVFEMDGDIYYSTVVACDFTGIGQKGTRFIILSAEFGISKLVRNNTNYYRRSELFKFLDWVKENYPRENCDGNTVNPEEPWINPTYDGC